MECRSRPPTANTRAFKVSRSTPFHAKGWMRRSRSSRKSAPASHRSSADPSPGMSLSSPGAKFRAALAAEKPLQVPGAICAYHAILAEKSGYLAIYLSGGGVAAGSLGVPDLGISGLDDVLTDVRRITDACALPLLVDVDTGFGASAFNIARTVKSLIKFGAAAMHIEDQVGAKRCGHRPNKELVTKDEMVDRIKAAVEARTELSMYSRFVDATKVPVLANITEFGSTPLFTVGELKSAGVAIALYPLSAFRAMNKAALEVYTSLRRTGTQQSVLDTMQTRAELYDYLGYHAYEAKLDALFAERPR